MHAGARPSKEPRPAAAAAAVRPGPGSPFPGGRTSPAERNNPEQGNQVATQPPCRRARAAIPSLVARARRPPPNPPPCPFVPAPRTCLGPRAGRMSTATATCTWPRSQSPRHRRPLRRCVAPTTISGCARGGRGGEGGGPGRREGGSAGLQATQQQQQRARDEPAQGVTKTALCSSGGRGGEAVCKDARALAGRAEARSACVCVWGGNGAWASPQ